MSDYKTYQGWADLWNSRGGHAGMYATANTPGITPIIEMSTIQDFADALEDIEELKLKNVASNPKDPPDCFANIEDRQVTIELVELVDGEAVAKARKGMSPYVVNGGQFLETQWNIVRFVTELNALIDRKHKKYAAKEQKFDCLLIHTAETWLCSAQVKTWLTKLAIFPRNSFKCVYLLMRYEGGQKHCPLFKIYGSLI